MVWAADSAAVTVSGIKGNAAARNTTACGILSRNPFLVSLRTLTAEIPCHHWRSAEMLARWGSTRKRVEALAEALRSLSAVISSANHSGAIDTTKNAFFSLLCLAKFCGIVIINCMISLCHRRHVLAWHRDTLRRNGRQHLNQIVQDKSIKNRVYQMLQSDIKEYQVTIQLHLLQLRIIVNKNTKSPYSFIYCN
jgi:hypothetical protein